MKNKTPQARHGRISLWLASACGGILPRAPRAHPPVEEITRIALIVDGHQAAVGGPTIREISVISG